MVNWAPYSPELLEAATARRGARSTRRSGSSSSPISSVASATGRRWCRSTRRSRSTRRAPACSASSRSPSCTWTFAASPSGNDPPPMRRFLLRRLVHGVFVVWGVVTAVFFLVRLTGDPAAFLVDQTATREEIEHTRHLLGLDRPLLTCSTSTSSLAVPRGDFGRSIRERRPALRVVLEHFWPATVELAAGGGRARHRARRPPRHRLRHPQGPGRRSPEPSRLALPPVDAELLARAPPDPALRGGAPRLAARLRRRGRGATSSCPPSPSPPRRSPRTRAWCGRACSRSSSEDYVRTARAKGVPERLVLYRHALRNAAIPFITVTGSEPRLHAERRHHHRDGVLVARARAADRAGRARPRLSRSSRRASSSSRSSSSS